LSVAPHFPEPKWLDTLPEADRPAARLRWILEIAAAYHSPEGAMTTLSKACGKADSTVSKAKYDGRISARLAIQIEQVLGRDIMPREIICPEFFAIEA
jgi:hypothetical protein